jgi:hypothetical protein
MRSFIAAVIIASLTVPSFAQGMGGQGMPGGKGHHGRAQNAEQPKKKSDDKAYKSALDTIARQERRPVAKRA